MSLAETQSEIQRHCEEILRLFKPGAEITVVVVNDRYGDAGLVISSGNCERARSEIDNRLRVAGKATPSVFTPKAADKLAIAVLRLIESGGLGTRTTVSDALERFADCRFDVMDGTGISKLRELAAGVTNG